MEVKFEAYTVLVLGFWCPGVERCVRVVFSNRPIPKCCCFILVFPCMVPLYWCRACRIKHINLVYAWEYNRGCRLWPAWTLRTWLASCCRCSLRTRCSRSCWSSCSCTDPCGGLSSWELCASWLESIQGLRTGCWTVSESSLCTSVSFLLLFGGPVGIERASDSDSTLLILSLPKMPLRMSQLCHVMAGVTCFGSTACMLRGPLRAEELESLQGFLTTCFEIGLPPHLNLNLYFIPKQQDFSSPLYANGPLITRASMTSCW